MLARSACGSGAPAPALRAELRPSPSPQKLFKLDRDRLAAQLSDAEDLIPIINSYSDADELNTLADVALCSGIVDREVVEVGGRCCEAMPDREGGCMFETPIAPMAELDAKGGWVR